MKIPDRIIVPDKKDLKNYDIEKLPLVVLKLSNKINEIIDYLASTKNEKKGEK